MPSPKLQTIRVSAPTKSAASAPATRWILSPRLDPLLFVATPLLIVPLAFFVQMPWIGVDVATISLVVSAFGGLGHHLPGMIRAYGDRELFQRFRLRFILAPLFLLAVCIPLSQYHLNAMLLILSIWGCWHALMQVYGFVRIYDVKVGSIEPATARWDWLMCVCWFSSAQIFSNGKMSRLLEHWYDSGGPLIPPEFVHYLRWGCLAVSCAVLIGFLVNHIIQTSKGAPPNPVKLLMLASGIGFWWFAMVFIDDIILGIALFEIFHDVQYLTIVWLYNCRRVNSNPDIGTFMRFVFRRGHGMLMLYVGLVLAYGLIGIVPREMQSDEIKRIIRGVIWASTILHFYYDGFIWKVRDNSTRAGLGLTVGENPSRFPQIAQGELTHVLKWSPLIVALSWLSITELRGSTLPAGGKEVRSWPHATLLARLENIAAAVPDDLRAQRRAATTMFNLGRTDEAIAFLDKLLARHPDFADGYQTLGEIYHLNGSYDRAGLCYRNAITHARSKSERTLAHHRMGEIYLLQKQPVLAKGEFREALKIDPGFEASIRALRGLEGASSDKSP